MSRLIFHPGTQENWFYLHVYESYTTCVGFLLFLASCWLDFWDNCLNLILIPNIMHFWTSHLLECGPKKKFAPTWKRHQWDIRVLLWRHSKTISSTICISAPSKSKGSDRSEGWTFIGQAGGQAFLLEYNKINEWWMNLHTSCLLSPNALQFPASARRLQLPCTLPLCRTFEKLFFFSLSLHVPLYWVHFPSQLLTSAPSQPPVRCQMQY